MLNLVVSIADGNNWLEGVIIDSIQAPGASDQRDTTGVHESGATIDLSVPEYFPETQSLAPTIWTQALYFTVSDKIYCRDIDGILYLVDEHSYQRTDDISPNPVLPGLTFQVGPFSYSFGEGDQLYILKDSPTNPWEPKCVYYDVVAARASLEPIIDAAALSSSESLNRDVPQVNWGEDPFDLNQFGLNELMSLLEDSQPDSAPISVATTSSSSGSNLDSQSTARIESPFSSSGSPPRHLSSPPAITNMPTPTASSPPSDPDAETFRTKDDVDKWVDSLSALRKQRGVRQPKPELKCPWPECKTTRKESGRPGDLKDHIYRHLRIKLPDRECSGCANAFSTKSNLKRHVKTCSYSNNG